MMDKLWKVVGLAAVSIAVLVCGVIVVHWAVGFVNWAGIDSGWAQFIGAIAALAVAIYLGERQHSGSIRLLKKADQLALERRLLSIVALMDEMVARVQAVKDMVLGEGLHAHVRQASTQTGSEQDHFVMYWACGLMAGRPQFAELVEAIDRIPMHELGHPEIVRALFSARELMNRYDDQLRTLPTQLDALSDVRPVLASVWNGSNVTLMLVTSARDQAKKAMINLLAQS